MKTLIFAFAAAPALAAPRVWAQAPSVDQQLVAARDTVWRAWFHHDTTLLHRFIPPAAATLEGREPRWNSRREILDDSRSFAASKQRFVDVLFRNTHISREGTSALVQSSYAVITEAGGKRDTTRGRATELFVKLGDTWVNPYWHLEEELPGSGREIALPDTMGAAFAVGDSANKAGSSADYDALLGTWEFRFQVRNGDGTFQPAFTGHWTFDKKPGGGLVEDHWRPDDPSTPTGVSLHTYRVFDADRKVWQMIGASSNGGPIQPGLTWSDSSGRVRFAIQRSRGVLVRIRYLDIEPDRFLWRSDRSWDDGKTWLRDAGIMEARRIGK
jgi:Domain of unknown function (DUF4440)